MGNQNLEKFIQKVQQAHPGMFVLNADIQYSGIDKDVTLECKIHGLITKRAKTFISGPGCNKCAYKMKMEKASALLKLFEQAELKKDIDV